MKAQYILGPALVAGLVTGLAGTADAAARARVTVTITAEGTDLSGVVRSAKPLLCAADRTVVVFKQKGARGGGDDQRFASDTTSLHNGVYEWSTGQHRHRGQVLCRGQGQYRLQARQLARRSASYATRSA